MKKLKFTFHGQDFYANMLTAQAPVTCEGVEKACPFTTRWVHAKIVANEIFCPTKIEGPVLRENPIPNLPGDIGLFDTPQTICCWHGDMKPLGSGNVFARFTPEQMEVFHAEATGLWKEPGSLVTVDVVEEE